ncbi:MAG: hypothetical protein ABIM89_19105 [Mycobacteriales bacterium]
MTSRAEHHASDEGDAALAGSRGPARREGGTRRKVAVLVLAVLGVAAAVVAVRHQTDGPHLKALMREKVALYQPAVGTLANQSKENDDPGRGWLLPTRRNAQRSLSYLMTEEEIGAAFSSAVTFAKADGWVPHEMYGTTDGWRGEKVLAGEAGPQGQLAHKQRLTLWIGINPNIHGRDPTGSDPSFPPGKELYIHLEYAEES